MSLHLQYTVVNAIVKIYAGPETHLVESSNMLASIIGSFERHQVVGVTDIDAVVVTERINHQLDKQVRIFLHDPESNCSHSGRLFEQVHKEPKNSTSGDL